MPTGYEVGAYRAIERLAEVTEQRGRIELHEARRAYADAPQAGFDCGQRICPVCKTPRREAG